MAFNCAHWMSNPVSSCNLPKVKMFPRTVPDLCPNQRFKRTKLGSVIYGFYL